MRMTRFPSILMLMLKMFGIVRRLVISVPIRKILDTIDKEIMRRRTYLLLVDNLTW